LPLSGLSRSDTRYDTRTDAELTAAVRRKDEAAFNVLYERYFQRVYNFAYARMHNRADAEEAVQETFTAVFKSIDAYSGRSPLLSWIYGIAKNTVNNQLRRARAHERRLERAEPALLRSAYSLDACTPEERLGLRRCSEAVEESLGSISTWQAEVFALRHLENMPIQEIAHRMARSNDAIRSSLYRVKRLVIETIDSEMTAERMGAVRGATGGKP
jgi:RNA polymerase sigma-70 factor (ECF subfamily)